MSWQQFKKGLISDLKDIGKGFIKHWKKVIFIYAISCIFLGSCFVKHDYDQGMEYYEQKRYIDAVKYFKKSANGQIGYLSSFDLRGNDKELRSSYMLGRCYFNGLGIEKDYSQAIKWLEKVANCSDCQSILKVDSAFKIGLCYFEGGNGIEKDYIEARKYFKKVINYSDCPSKTKAGSAFMIGACYFKGGNGIKQDHTKAYDWFKKARDYDPNCEPALFILGVCYYEGKGVKKNYIEAFKLLKKASESNSKWSADAYFLLGECYRNGYGTYGSAKDCDKEKECKKKAAEKGCPKGQCWLGFELRRGLEEDRDYSQAVCWFEKAAEQGDVDAMKELAWHYRNGKGVKKDIKMAQKWEEKAKKFLEKKDEN